MSLVRDILIATALIAAFVVFRMLADRYISRGRKTTGEFAADCEHRACHARCSQKGKTSKPRPDADIDTSNRRASHAP